MPNKTVTLDHSQWAVVLSALDHTADLLIAEGRPAHLVQEAYRAVKRQIERTPRPTTYGGVRQTACRFCGLDIEGFAPYRKGEWRDRGNNTRCNDGKHAHAPVR